MKLIVSVSLILLALLILPFVITIKTVHCNSQFGKCSPSVEKLTEDLVGITYKELDHKINSIEEFKTDVKEFSYYFIPPSTLNINVVEKKGEVSYKNVNESEYLIVSRDLTVIKKTKDTQLPVVYIENNELIGSEDFGFVTELMISLSRYYSVREAIWSKNSFSIIYNGTTEIIFPTTGDIDVELGSMEVMLFQLNQALQNSKIDGVDAEDISTIDLRYNNPIIK